MRCATASPIPLDWFAIIFNPSFFYRLRPHAHRRLSHDLARRSWRWARATCSPAATSTKGARCCAWRSGCWRCSAPLQLLIGDQHGLNTLEHQPIKIAAIEAHWDGSKPGALVLFAWPDEKTETNLFEIAIPQGRIADPHARSRRSLSRAQERAAVRPSAAGAGVLRVPHHGRHRRHHDRGRTGRRLAVVARTLFETRWYLWLAAHAGGSASSP